MSTEENPFSDLPVELTQEEKMDLVLSGIQQLKAEVSSIRTEFKKKFDMLEPLIVKVAKLEEICEGIPVLHKQINDLTMRVVNAEDLTSSLITKNKELKIKLDSYSKLNDKNLDKVSIDIDDKQQHTRCSYIRVNGVSIDPENEKKYGHNQACMMALDETLQPLLKLNKDSTKLPCKEFGDYLENAHCLKIPDGAKDGSYKCPPIIAKFIYRDIKDYILRNKGKIELRDVDKDKGVSRYAFTADLTKMRFERMQKLIKSKRFYKIWHINGKIIKYIKNKGGNVCTVSFFQYTINEWLTL